jgi:hypothetical protein
MGGNAMRERDLALAFARRIVPGITDADLYEIHDCWGGYWQIYVPREGRLILYNFGRQI